MKFNTFSYVSLHKWCDSLPDFKSLEQAVKGIYVHGKSEITTYGPVDYHEADDDVLDPTQHNEDNLITLNGQIRTGDLYFAAVENAICYKKNLLQKTYHIFVDDQIALAESCGNLFYSLKATEPEMIKFPASAMNLKELNMMHHADDMVEVRFYVQRAADRIINEPRVLLTSLTADNYCHFLVEVLSRLWYIDQNPALKNVPILLPEMELQPFQKEIIDRLAAKGIQFEFFTDDALEFKKLYVPSLGSGWSPDQLKFIRNFMLDLYDLKKETSPTKLIFISREDAKSRCISNEDEIWQYAKAQGFERYVLSELSVKEQIELFQSAKIVLAPHGAGNANMIFADPSACLIELLPKNYRHRIYWIQTKFMGQKYGRFLGGYPKSIKREFDVDIESFKKFFAPILNDF